MIEVKNVCYTNCKSYHQNNHLHKGWAIMIMKIEVYMKKPEVEIIMIESQMIEKYILQKKINHIIIIDLNLYCEVSINYTFLIKLNLSQELYGLIQLLFTRFESADRTYLVDSVIEMIVRKIFRKNFKCLQDQFEIFKLITLIHEKISENLTVSDLAKFMHMSKPTLNRFCIKKLNKVPLELIKDIKITCAKNFLESTDEKIYEIGKRVGYSNPSAFTIFFKRETGLSPKEYRENYFCVFEVG